MTKPVVQEAVQAAEPVLEEVAKVVDQQIETVSRIPRLRLNGTTRSQQIVILGVTAALGAAAGSAITYKIVQKKMRTEYEELLSVKIQEARDYYRVLGKKENEDPVEALAKYSDAVREHGYVPEDESETEDVIDESVVLTTAETLSEPETKHEQVSYNIFEDSATLDFGAEREARDSGKPFVITYDEYMENEEDYAEANLTYFLADDILAGEDELPIEGVDELIGEDNLRRFGQGSRDNNSVFVRNPKTRTQYEIHRSTGSYAKEVHGLDPEPESELRHSHQTPRRFRNRDE